MAKTKNKIPEGKLLKALAELEDSVEKGDALEDADPEGGFSTEGTPLSDAAPSGRSDAKKSRRSSSSSSSDDSSSSTAKAFSASDMASSADDAGSKKKKSKKTAKAFPPKAKDSDSSSDDDSSSADGDSDDDSSSTEKSFRTAAEQDETMSKAIEVSDFLEAMVDQLSLTMLSVVNTVKKSIADMENRLNARIDNRVAKGVSLQQDFNSRLAKAISVIGTSVEGQADLVKSLANAPAAPRGKALLSKGDVNQPPWGGHGGGGGESHMADGSDLSELAGVPSDKIGDWLFAKSARNQIDPKLILAWEANHYDTSTLPEEIQKSLANDLLK